MNHHVSVKTPWYEIVGDFQTEAEKSLSWYQSPQQISQNVEIIKQIEKTQDLMNLLGIFNEHP